MMLKNKPTDIHNQNGISIIEALCSIVIVGLSVFAIIGYQRSALRSQNEAAAILTMQQVAASVTSMIAASYDPTLSKLLSVAANNTTVCFSPPSATFPCAVGNASVDTTPIDYSGSAPFTPSTSCVPPIYYGFQTNGNACDFKCAPANTPFGKADCPIALTLKSYVPCAAGCPKSWDVTLAGQFLYLDGSGNPSPINPSKYNFSISVNF